MIAALVTGFAAVRQAVLRIGFCSRSVIRCWVLLWIIPAEVLTPPPYLLRSTVHSTPKRTKGPGLVEHRLS